MHELLEHIDDKPIDEYGLRQSLDLGQIGSPEEKSFSMDELLGHIDDNLIDEYGAMQSLDFVQIGSPKESNNPHVGTTLSLFYELENRDAMLSGILPHAKHTPSGVDYGLPLNFNGEGEDTPFLDLDYDLNQDSRGMQGRKTD
ncbi:hypothetical protein MtrunA17_Chr5g0437651 [Medicago truncatula]|uniref:Uncharacterized protein n=1 Tax=Medicago truncatula TaxID=3880 RepID=A0A396I0H0_MEDTR|nr:hypothetical protein MtrunA17_Chr5g0437651 [Medicago truncatula]